MYMSTFDKTPSSDKNLDFMVQMIRDLSKQTQELSQHIASLESKVDILQVRLDALITRDAEKSDRIVVLENRLRSVEDIDTKNKGFRENSKFIGWVLGLLITLGGAVVAVLSYITNK